MGRFVPWVLLGIACNPQNFVPVVIDTGDATEPTPPVTRVNDDLGSLVVATYREDDRAGAFTALRAIFVVNDFNVTNLASCIGLPDFGCALDTWPEDPDDIVELFPPGDRDVLDLLDQLATRDLGDTIPLGQWELRRGEDQGRTFYSAQPGVLTPGGETLDVAFAGDWDPWTGSIGPTPEPLILTSHDATELQRFASSEPLVLTWETSDLGDVYLLAVVKAGTVGERRFLQRLSDDGQHTVNLNAFGALVDGDPLHFQIGRWVTYPLDVEGHTVNVELQANQWLRGTFSALGVREPLPAGLPYEDCTDAEGQPPLPAGSYFGDMNGYRNDFLRAEGGCEAGPSSGPDGIIPLRVEAEELVTISYRQRDDDAVLYLTEGLCDGPPSCIDVLDDAGRSLPEAIAWRNTTGAAVDLQLVLDTVQGPITELFELDIEVDRVSEDPLWSSCADALTAGALPSGYYYGQMGTFTNLLDCAPVDENTGEPMPMGFVGGDAKAQVYVLPGQTLTASVIAPGANPRLYIAYNCSVPESCVASAGSSLTYFNGSGVAEFVYLVLDSEVSGAVQDYFLDLEIQ